MKKIIYRNFLTDCLIFFSVALFSTSIIIWVFQSVNYLDIIIDDGRDYLVYLRYSLLNFPKIVAKIFGIPLLVLSFFALLTYDYEIKSCGGLDFEQSGDTIYLNDGTSIKGEYKMYGRVTTLSSFTGHHFDDERLPFNVLMHGYYKTHLDARWQECSYYEGQKRFLGIKYLTTDYDGKGLNPNNDSIYD